MPAFGFSTFLLAQTSPRQLNHLRQWILLAAYLAGTKWLVQKQNMARSDGMASLCCASEFPG